MDESELPEEVRRLPTLSLGNNDIDHEELYTEVRGDTCRRCKGSGQDPDGKYPCLLCRGSKIEKYLDGSKMFCVKHPGKELVNIAKRHITWELMGFDHEGFLAIQGCPICKIPVYSVK